MARLGILTSEFEAPSLDAVLRQVTSCGVRSAQLQLGSALPGVPMREALSRGLEVLGASLDRDLADRIRTAFGAHGVELAAVDGTYNMVHPDRARRTRCLAQLRTLIELAPSMGTGVVTLCTGSRNDVMWVDDPANREASAWIDLVEQMRSAASAAEAAGVTLAFEPEHSNVVDSAAGARALIDEVGSPAVKVLFDPANIFHVGDLARMRDHLEDAVRLVGRDVVLVHAKDLDHDGAAGGRAAGRGVLDYPLFLELMQRSGYDGPVVLHGLQELDRAGVAEALRFVRRSAPSGYLMP